MTTERQPITLFGVNDIRLYNRTTGYSICHLRVLGDVNAEFNAEIEKLTGGSLNYTWASAVKSFNSSLKATVKEFNPELAEVLLGAVSTDYTASATGDVINEANVVGTTSYSGTTGIASVTVTPTTGDAQLKEGWYIFKATAATKGKIYAYSSTDFARGTNEVYDNDDGLVTGELTLSNGGTTDVDYLGLRLTGGSGVAMTIGDTCRFYVQKPHGGSWHVKFGQSSSTFDDVGVVIGGQNDNETFMFLHLFKCKVAGMAVPFKEKGYGTYDITIEPAYDVDEDAFGEIRVTTAE
jgi:hypothetical protein